MTKSEALAKVKELMKQAIAAKKSGAIVGFKYQYVEEALNNLHMQLQLHNMTGDDAELTIQQVEGVLAQAKTAPSAPESSGGMTPEEYKKQKSALFKKVQAGEMTNYAYIQWKKKNNPAKQAQNGPVSASAGKKEQKPAEKTKDAEQPKKADKMTPKEYDQLYDMLYEQKEKGVITDSELSALSNELGDMDYHGKSKAEAEEILKSAIQLSDENGIPIQDAINAVKKTPMTESEMKDLKAELTKKYTDGEITWDELNDIGAEINQAYKDGQTLEQAKALISGKPVQEGPMTHAEYISVWEELNKKKKAGEITEAEYSEYGKVLDDLYKQKATMWTAKAAVNLAPVTDKQVNELTEQLLKKVDSGKITFDEFNAIQDKALELKAQGKNFKEVQSAMGLDPGTLATEAAVDKLENDLTDVYTRAAKELKAKLQTLEDEYTVKLNEMGQKLANGEITTAQYHAWVNGKLMQADQVRKLIDQCSGVLLNANQVAVGMVNGQQVSVFAENANYQAYQITKDANMNLMFAIYDESTVKKLIKDQPELLPQKMVNGQKDTAWNRENIANAMAHAVIQGESIPKIARRVANDTASTNLKAMVRYARTAMTAAQNSGRMDTLHRAKGMGIKCKKCWLATLDSRTRDSHQQMDEKTADIDEKFPNGLMYPGDPSGPPAEVWNCRCTLTYEYDGYPADPTANDRLMYEEWDETIPVKKKDKNGHEYQASETVHHRERRLIADMSYPEWKAAKQGSALNELNVAKQTLAQKQKYLIEKKINENKVYKDLWKEDVTLADYPTKKDSIKAKRDYYTAEIEKYKQAQAEGKDWATDEKIKELEKKRKLLNEFDLNGRVVAERNEALKKVQEIYDKTGYQQKAAAPIYSQPKTTKKAGTKAAKQSLSAAAGELKTPFGPEAYTKERKDKALWTTDKRKVDSIMRKKTGEMWRKASAEERVAIHEYTYTYKKFNEPLRGIEYGTSRYLGVGKTDLNAGSKRSGRKLNAITDLLDRCSYDHDMWLNRGVRFGGMDKFFNCPMNLLQHGSQKELESALLGTTPTEYAFGSMGSAKGEGFSGDIIMNIYAPAGTKMLFAEPWSYYGRDEHGRMHDMDGVNWDGKSTQPSYGTEFETILQQGTQFRVTKVTRRGTSGTIFVDLEVINQDNQQRWKP